MTPFRDFRYIKLAVVTGLAGAWVEQAQAQATPRVLPDTLRGLVRDAASAPVVDAAITVTRGPDRLVQRATTDSSGRFSVVFAEGTGDYLVHAAREGWLPVRRRVVATSPGRTPAIELVVRPAPVLATVRVQAVRPTRASATVPVGDPGTGASERWSDGANGQVSPVLAGDLTAVAATIPGGVLTAGGLSIGGASPASTLTTLNGLELGGAALPRSARTEVRLSSTTFDATRGGFAGGNLDVRLAPGDRNFQRRNAYVSAQPTPVGAALGRHPLVTPSAAFRGSLGADGELVRGRVLYNVAVDLTQQTIGAASITAASSWASQYGVSAGTVDRLTAAGVARGLPVLGATPSPTTRAGSWLGRIDWLTDSVASVTLTSLLSRTRREGLGLAPTATGRSAATGDDNLWGLQLTRTDYVGPGRRVLSQQRVGVTQTTQQVTPAWPALPDVRVSPTLATGGSGAAPSTATLVALGGRASGAVEDRRLLVEGLQDVYWNARGRAHRWHAQAGVRMEALAATLQPNALGSYQFPSVEAFEANRPSTFQRQLGAVQRDGRVWNGSVAINDEWTRTRRLTLTAGVRLDGAGTLAPTPVASRVATRWTLSPRAGFTYVYNTTPAAGLTSAFNPVGRFTRGQLGVLRGGIGRFQDLLRPGMVLGETSTAPLLVQCVGDASPAWDGNDAPTTCANGAGALGLRGISTTRTASDFAAPESWRASLNWSTALRRFSVRVDGLASWNRHRPGLVDANFTAVPVGQLADEGQRPLFVPLSGIDPSTGAVSAQGSRRDPSTNFAWMRVSDLEGRAGLVTVTVAPNPTTFRSRIPLFGALSYTLQRATESQRGFDAPSGMTPDALVWSAATADVRHTVVLQGGIATKRTGAWTVFLRAQSGAPFTPVVQQDITGDGVANDAAYIPAWTGAPAAGTSAVAQALASAAPSFPSYARTCLEAAAGRIAPRNSCRGPWAPTLSLQWMPPLRTTVFGRALGASVFFENPLGGLDRLLHGADGLRGWGGTRQPDPVLLVPRKFDPSTARFMYAVNPQFGSLRSLTSGMVRPFRVVVELSLDLSVPFPVQTLRRALEPPLRGTATTRPADSLATFFARRRVGNLFQFVLAESDSLFLTSTQVATLRQESAAYASEARSRYVPLGQFLEGRTGQAIDKAALDSVKATEDAYQQQFWRSVERVTTVLTPSQVQLLPLLTQMLATPATRRATSFFGFGHPVELFPATRRSALP